MMNFEDFCGVVQKNMKHYLPPQYQAAEIRIQTNNKVNVGDLVGATLTMPGSSIGPIVYLNSYYKDVSDGVLSMGEALDRIAHQGAQSLEGLRRDPLNILNPERIATWSLAKENIYPAVIGRTRNESLLKTVPHREMGDIACVYRINLFESSGADGSVLITNSIMKGFGITEEQLYQTAVTNTLKNNPPSLHWISDVVDCMRVPGGLTEKQKERLAESNLLDDRHGNQRSVSGEEQEPNWWEEEPEPEEERGSEEEPDEDYKGLDFSDDIPLLILTTYSMSRGAAVVFIPEVMDKIQQKMPEGFYVLPSSIHEVMILPKQMCSSPEQLDEMISAINDTEVSPEDQLSDLCHEYDAEKKLLVCPTAPELNKVHDEPTLDEKVIL